MEEEFKDIKDYILYRLNCIENIYSTPDFTPESKFYKNLQRHWIIEYDRKEDWKNKLKYNK